MKYKAKWKKEKLKRPTSFGPKPGYGRMLAKYRWEHMDPVHPEFWTAYTVTVHGPTHERPQVNILYSMSNGGGRCFCRYPDVESLNLQHTIPKAGVERLQQAVTQAQELLEDIRREIRFLSVVRDLSPGAALYRTDTGDQITEEGGHYDVGDR